jgi:hypothetical protein
MNPGLELVMTLPIAQSVWQVSRRSRSCARFAETVEPLLGCAAGHEIDTSVCLDDVLTSLL